MKTITQNTFASIAQNSLFKNSIQLILSTGVLSVFGFLFWVISTKLLSPDEIGIATTMISAMSIISVFSLLGFDSSIVRFLANSPKKNSKLNTSIILVGVTTLILSSLFVILISKISPQLLFIRENIFIGISFILFCTATSINILTDAVFLSYRQTKYTLYINIIFSFVKMFLPLLFYRYGAFGIFLAAALGQTVGFIFSIFVMVWKFDYKPELTFDKEIIKEVWLFCVGNYLSGALNLLPVAILPLIITNKIGLKEAAYFYMIMMIMNLLYTIPQAVTRSLFAEGSYDENNFEGKVKQASIIISLLVIPAIIFLVVFGNKLLLIFGKKYTESSAFLSVMSFSAIFICINALFNSFFRIKKNINGLVLSSIAYSSGIMLFTYLFIGKGLLGIGLAWILGTALSTIVSFTVYRFYFAIGKHKILKHLPYWRGFDDRLEEVNMYFFYKIKFLLAFVKNGFKYKTAVFYPEKPTPKKLHLSYKIMHQLGYKITSNPEAKADAYFILEDTTVRTPDPKIEELKKNHRLINYGCGDISKERVEEVFQNVFGYGTFVDPETHNGTCVRKSSTNAMHDGKIVTCPTKREDGYIYQKFIDTYKGDRRIESRLIIMGKEIPFIVKRYKTKNDPFNSTYGGDIVETNTELSPEEIKKVLEFCEKFGLDYGEIDSLRDNTDGKLYLVDANNTPSGPRPGRSITRYEYNFFIDRQIKSFVSAFLS